MITALGMRATNIVYNAGQFSRFVWRSNLSCISACFHAQTFPLVWTQMNIIGVRSVPVIMITGAFVGMTLAVQAYDHRC